MIERFYQSIDVRQILKPTARQYQSGHGWKRPYKNSSMYSVEGSLKKQGDKKWESSKEDQEYY